LPVQCAARAIAVTTVVILLAAAPVSDTWSPTANAATAESGEAAQDCSADVPRLRFVVLFKQGTERDAAAAAIAAACGATVIYYPEIAVAVASSTESSFADLIGRGRAYSAQAEGLPGVERRIAPRNGRALLGEFAGAARTGEPAGEGEQWNLAMIRAGEAGVVTAGSRDVLVGVLDSGIDADHPELSAALDRSASVDCTTGEPNTGAASWRPTGQHGTHVAGLIAAADDGKGITGVAPGVRIASVKVVDADGFIYPEYAVCGFVWAAKHGMRITNNSYFIDPWLFTCSDQPGQSVVHEAVGRAVAYATTSGVLSVAAIGNEGVDLTDPGVDTRSPNNSPGALRRPVDDSCDVLPAELPGVLTVSAVGAQGVKSSYSSYGADVVDIAAPGGDLRQRVGGTASGCVLSTVPGGGYGRMCGTSMAAPHVTGVAALVASKHPEAGPAELSRLVTGSAAPVDCPASYDPNSDGRPDATCEADSGGEPGSGPNGEESNGFYGAGIVDAMAAVSR
jgi:subtilisin family serine protease